MEKRQIVCQIVMFWQETVVQIFQTTRRKLYEKPTSRYSPRNLLLNRPVNFKLVQNLVSITVHEVAVRVRF